MTRSRVSPNTHECPACASQAIATIVEIASVPVHVGSLWPTADDAKSCPRGDISLRHCRECQLVFNAAFDPKPLEYTGDYDNSLEASAVFREFASSLAGDLIERYELHEKTVVEIGCGTGERVGAEVLRATDLVGAAEVILVEDR